MQSRITKKTRKDYRTALIVFGLLLAAVLYSYKDYIAAQLSYSPEAASHAPVSIQRPADTDADETPAPKVEPNMLWIDSLTIKAPIIEPSGRTEKLFQEALQRGVVHYPGTAGAGEPGNMYVFGHSSDYAWSKGEYKTVFALLPKIKAGDLIIVSGRDGTPYWYRVTETAVVSPKDMSVLDQYGNEKRMLTLQTSYPVGTALKRFIARAELIEK